MFEQHEDWWHNACIQNYSVGFDTLARYYQESAIALLEQAADDTSKLDVYVYAAVFLYRHSVELALKGLIWESSFLLGKGKFIPRVHCLTKLWQILKGNAHSLLDPNFPLTTEEVHVVEASLQEIAKHDPESCAFRYPFDKNGRRTHPDVTYINVRTLREQFSQIHDYLTHISYVVGSLYEAHVS